MRRLLAGAMTLGISVPALQALAEPFVGGSLGQSDIDSSITNRGLLTSGTIDGKDTAFKLFSGYMFTPHVGFESAYVNLGDVTYSGQFGALPVTGGIVEATGFTLSLLGSYPVSERFSILGKVGLFIWEWRASDTTAGQPFATTEDGSDLMFGLGMGYSFARNWSVRAEWERFKLDEADASLISIGVLWRF